MYKIDQKIAKVETIMIATPPEGVTLDELKRKLEELGNPILEVNYKENHIKMIHSIKSEG